LVLAAHVEKDERTICKEGGREGKKTEVRGII